MRDRSFQKIDSPSTTRQRGKSAFIFLATLLLVGGALAPAKAEAQTSIELKTQSSTEPADEFLYGQRNHDRVDAQIRMLNDDRYAIRRDAMVRLSRVARSGDPAVRQHLRHRLAIVIDRVDTSFEQRTSAGRLWRIAGESPSRDHTPPVEPPPVPMVGRYRNWLPDTALVGPTVMPR